LLHLFQRLQAQIALHNVVSALTTAGNQNPTEVIPPAVASEVCPAMENHHDMKAHDCLLLMVRIGAFAAEIQGIVLLVGFGKGFH
jgi:hypothetical protein